MMRAFFVFAFVLLAPCQCDSDSIDDVTSAEYQINLYTEPFKDREKGVKDLGKWLDENLEDKPPANLPKMTVKLGSTTNYGRNISLFSLNETFPHVVKYRKTFEGDNDQNDVVWKIRKYTPGTDVDLFKPASKYKDDWSYKIEQNAHCDERGLSVDYSSYVSLPMKETANLETVADVEKYFPSFGAFYGLDGSFKFEREDDAEYVSDVDCKMGKANDKCKLTTQLRYDSYADYVNQILPTTAIPELSLKIKRKNTADWNNALTDAYTVYGDLIQICPYASC